MNSTFDIFKGMGGFGYGGRASASSLPVATVEFTGYDPETLYKFIGRPTDMPRPLSPDSKPMDQWSLKERQDWEAGIRRFFGNGRI